METRAAALILLLAVPAGAQVSLEGAFDAARAFRPATPLPTVALPAPKAVLRLPAPAEAAAPDAFDSNDVFRAALLAPGRSDRWLVPVEFGQVLLVVEKNYLSDARLDQLCADIQEAVSAVPRLTGRPPLIKTRFTVYVYDEGPLSEADVPGLRPGEKGLMLRFVKDDAEPLFHELTHMLAGYSDSQSLGEGIADWVQETLRPGRAHAFVPANTNPDAMAKAALAKRPAAFKTTIGAPGYWFQGSNKDIRFDFYYCSWSFARFLMKRGDVKAFWSVADAGGKPAAYLKAYGRSYDRLISDWTAEIDRP
jgi:hypothetical protein